MWCHVYLHFLYICIGLQSKLDILFLIDASTTQSTQDINQLKQLLRETVKNLDVSSTDNRVSFILSGKLTSDIKFLTNYEEVIGFINSITKQSFRHVFYEDFGAVVASQLRTHSRSNVYKLVVTIALGITPPFNKLKLRNSIDDYLQSKLNHLLYIAIGERIREAEIQYAFQDRSLLKFLKFPYDTLDAFTSIMKSIAQANGKIWNSPTLFFFFAGHTPPFLLFYSHLNSMTSFIQKFRFLNIRNPVYPEIQCLPEMKLVKLLLYRWTYQSSHLIQV